MGGKKLLTLCVDHMLFDEMELGFMDNKPFPEVDLMGIDPFMFIDLLAVSTPTSTKSAPDGYMIPPFVYFERMGGFDLFHAVDLAKLTPDNPPPANVKTLPGTNRRPIKAWQAMSKLDQEVELSLACSLDAIWELAIEDGIELPDPEDRTLLFDHFPERRRIWKLFRVWYAGEEDTNPLPGQGIPTLARVIFAEKYELKQIDDDPLVVEAMKKNNLPIPVKYREGELDIEMLAATFGGTRRNTQVKQRSAAQPTDSAASNISTGSNKSGRRARPQRQQSSLRKSVFLEENIETMKQAYEQAMNTIAGTSVRQEMVSMTLNKVLESKRMQTLKWMWPPGLNRMGLQYLMPRAGFALPKFSLPEKRFNLFPKRINDAFNFHEIAQWFSATELDQEDIAMRKAEAKGVKLRAYHEWLAHEPERIEQSRKDMLEEDDLGWQRREIEKVLNARLAQIQVRLVEMDEELDDSDSPLRVQMTRDYIEEQTKPFESVVSTKDKKKKKRASTVSTTEGVEAVDESAVPADAEPPTTEAEGDAIEAEDDDDADGVNDPSAPIPAHRKIDASFLAKKFFRFGLPLPKEYWYIFEESAEFKYGSGIHNDDEAEEIANQQRLSAQKALEDAYNLEKYLNEEKKRRDEEEKARQKREEQDRRLKEGVLRRRQIREHFEEVKRQRVIKAAEEKARKEEQMLAEMLEKQRREEEEHERTRLQQLEADRQREMQLMHQEEVYTRDYKICMREMRMMEHEDIVSFLQEQIAVREEEKRQARIRELEEIYTPFEPFRFKKSRIRLPQLHAVLQEKDDKGDEEIFLQEVLDSMTLPGSRSTTSGAAFKFAHPHMHHGNHEYFASNKLQEHDTESSIRHRSKRYMSLYGDVKYHPEILHENPEAIAAEEARRAEEERNWLFGNYEGEDEDDEQAYGYEDYLQDDFDSRSMHSGSRDGAATAQDAGVVVGDGHHGQHHHHHHHHHHPHHPHSPDPSGRNMEQHPGSPGTLRFDVSESIGPGGDYRIGEHGDSDDQQSTGGRSMSSTSSRGSRHRRRTRPPTSSKQILSPRTGNNLVQRSVDSFPTKERIQKMTREAKKRLSGEPAGDPTQLLSMNPYEGHWMLLQRPTPVLYSSAPVMVQPTFHGTGVEALTASPPRSKQRASRLLRPLKKQLKKDMEMVHSATTSALPGLPFTSEPSLQQVRSSPYLPTALSPLASNDKLNTLDEQMFLQQLATASNPLHPPHHQLHSSTMPSAPDHDDANSLFETDSQNMSQASSFFHAGSIVSGKSRKKMQNLLALSSDALAKGDPKSWMKMMRTQRALALASLSTIEGGGAGKHLQQERQKLIDIGEKQNGSKAKAHKVIALQRLASPSSKKEKPLVDAEMDLMDFKTVKLAQAASETVNRLRQQSDRVRAYVNSDALVHDEFFLAATRPGVHESDAIASSPIAEKFRRDIVEKLNMHEQSEQRQSQSAGEAFKDTTLDTEPKRAKITKPRHSFVSSISTVTHSAKSQKPQADRPGSPLKVVPTPGPKAVGALFGSTMKIASKDKFQSLTGDSQEVVALEENKKVKGKQVDTLRRKVQDRTTIALKAEPTPLVFHESSLASKLSSSSAAAPADHHPLSLEEGDEELTSSMSIVPLRSSSPSSPSRPPRTPSTPVQRSRSVKSLDLFIKTPRSARVAGEEIELEVKNTLSLLPSSAQILSEPSI